MIKHQLTLKNVRYSKSFSLSYTTRKSVSYSLSYVSSNTLEFIYDEIKGTYTMTVSQMFYYSNIRWKRDYNRDVT